MCLDLGWKEHRIPLRTVRVAYKIVYADQRVGFLESLHFNFYFKPGWQKDRNRGRINIDDRHSYPTGFHVYTKQEDALSRAFRDEIVVRVKVRKIVVEGMQLGLPTLVAKEIWFPKSTRRRQGYLDFPANESLGLD